LSVFGFYPWIAPLFQGFALLILVLLIVLMLRMLKHNRVRAILLLVMFLPSLLAVLAQALRNLGILPTSFWTTHLWELTTFLQIPFAAVLVLLRVREEERKHRLAQEREQAQRGLLNMIAHELRTPLSVLDAAVANLEARIDSESPELRPRFQRIHAALARLNSLVDNALAEDRLREGGMQLEMRPVEPSKLLQQVRELMGGGDLRHEVRIGVPEDDRPVAMDQHWLGLALLNLLDNAIKYSPQGGAIELEAARHDGYLEFQVGDEGIGIPPEALAEIGTRFFRAENARRLAGVRGLGLGLFLVREVARRHGGQLRLRSRLGQGSVFILRIPA
jgi:signal transduction histidine kinase